MITMSIGRAIDLCSVDNASRREPPIVTASRTGQLESAAVLASYGADLEARDGQVPEAGNIECIEAIIHAN